MGDITLEQIKKIAHIKMENMLSYKESAAVKEVLGTCVSMGVTVEGRSPREVQQEL